MGVRFGLRPPEFNCQKCTEKNKTQRNCHNRQNRRESITSSDEWLYWPESLKPVAKYGDLKLWECPLTTISRKTWDLISLINETTNYDGEVLHLPFNGSWLDQPSFYREAVRITKHERQKHRAKEMEKTNAKRNINGKR